MTPQQIKDTENKILELETWVKNNKGHTNLNIVVNNIKVLKLTLQNALENG